jgi:hypothetical protein
MRPLKQLLSERQPVILLLTGLLGIIAVSGSVWLAKLRVERLVPLQSLATNPSVRAESYAPTAGLEATAGGFITPRSASIYNGNLFLSGRVFRVPGEPWGSLGRFLERNFIQSNKF